MFTHDSFRSTSGRSLGTDYIGQHRNYDLCLYPWRILKQNKLEVKIMVHNIHVYCIIVFLGKLLK